ncbi:MAG TPA: histidine kinase [Clostridia bacterium]|nr:histidine kinase [Clostridia bacterium]
MRFHNVSIRLRTAALLLAIYVLFFGLMSALFVGTSSTAVRTQAQEHAAKALELMRTSLDATLNASLISMYAYLENEQIFYGDQAALKAHFGQQNKYFVGTIGILAVMDRSGLVYANSEKWLYSLDIDPEVYFRMARLNRLLITGPYYSPMLTARAVALIRWLHNAQTGQDRLVLAEIATRSLFSDLLIKLSAQETIIALAADGSTLFMDYGSRLLTKTGSASGMLDISAAMRKALLGMRGETAALRVDGLALTVQKTVSNQGWQLYWLIDAAQFNRTFTVLQRTYLILAAGAITLLMGVSLLTSGWVLNPVRRMADDMDRISADAPRPMPEIPRKDEIGRLYVSFAQLMQRLHSAHERALAMEQTRHKLEYRVLQSQIQPHFLLNINRCVSALLENGAPDRARDMLDNMDSLLRMSLDGREMIPLAEEIDILERYCALQKLRLGETFDYRIDGWEAYAQVPVPKLLLQPLVENALRHGLAGLTQQGEIAVRVVEIQGLIHITVTDNGRGIPTERMEEVRRGEIRPVQGMVSIGLDNVRSRIAGHYGPDCGLYISSRVNIGTEVEVVISKQPNP